MILTKTNAKKKKSYNHGQKKGKQDTPHNHKTDLQGCRDGSVIKHTGYAEDRLSELVEGLPSMKETLGSIPKATQTRYGDVDLLALGRRRWK